MGPIFNTNAMQITLTRSNTKSSHSISQKQRTSAHVAGAPLSLPSGRAGTHTHRVHIASYRRETEERTDKAERTRNTSSPGLHAHTSLSPLRSSLSHATLALRVAPIHTRTRDAALWHTHTRRLSLHIHTARSPPTARALTRSLFARYRGTGALADAHMAHVRRAPGTPKADAAPYMLSHSLSGWCGASACTFSRCQRCRPRRRTRSGCRARGRA